MTNQFRSPRGGLPLDMARPFIANTGHMSAVYTTLWSRDRCQAARKHAPTGFRFEILFGGPHTSLPGFGRAGVRPDDWIYLISVRDGLLHVLGRMNVARVMTAAEYRETSPDVAAQFGAFDLAVRVDDAPLRQPRARLEFLAPTCVDEVVMGRLGTPLLFEATVPCDQVGALRYTSRRGERPIKHVDETGRVRSTVSLQGVCRLADASAEILARVVDAAARD
jgi:hypothetical protein